MKHLYSLAIFFGLNLIGDVIVKLTGFFIPGGIIGMILLFVLLCLRVIKLESIQKTGAFLLDNMMVFILPAAVGLVSVWHLISDKLISYLFMNVATTIIIFIVTAYTAQGLIHVNKRLAGKKEEVKQDGDD